MSKRQFLETNGLVSHVCTSGPPGAPAVLLIHSLGASLEIWEQQAQALGDHWFVIRYDLRGHGLSEPPAPDAKLTVEELAADALAILDALGVKAAHVAGISIGGLIAQAIAKLALERVRSLILCDSSMAMPPPEPWIQRAAAVRKDGLEPLVDGTMERWVGEAYRATAAGRGLRNLILRTTVAGYAAAAEALATADLTDSTPQLAARRKEPLPALVLVGEHDPSTPLAKAQELVAALPGATLVVIPGAHHIPLDEHADAVNAAFLAHLGPIHSRGSKEPAPAAPPGAAGASKTSGSQGSPGAK